MHAFELFDLWKRKRKQRQIKDHGTMILCVLDPKLNSSASWYKKIMSGSTIQYLISSRSITAILRFEVLQWEHQRCFFFTSGFQSSKMPWSDLTKNKKDVKTEQGIFVGWFQRTDKKRGTWGISLIWFSLWHVLHETWGPCWFQHQSLIENDHENWWMPLNNLDNSLNNIKQKFRLGTTIY